MYYVYSLLYFIVEEKARLNRENLSSTKRKPTYNLGHTLNEYFFK